MNWKRWLIGLLLAAAPVAARAEEQPPYEVKDAGAAENFRRIYYDVDKLSLLTSTFAYTLDATTNRFCIDSPTFCINLLTHAVTVSGIGNFSVTRSGSGANVESRVENTSNTAGSGALLTLYSAGSSAGDAFIRFSNDSGSSDFWSWGEDQSDGRAMVLSRSATPGTNNAIRFENAGTTPLVTIGSMTATLASNLIAANSKITGLRAGTANGDSVRFEQLAPGKILQIIVISTTNAQKTSTTGAYATTGLSGPATLTAATSVVLVYVMQNFGASGTAGTVCTARLRRDSTDFNTPGDYHVAVNDSTTEFDSGVGLVGTDTPGSVGPFTYSTVFARSAGTGTCIVNTTTGAVGGNGGYMLLLEVGK